jgi:diadenosine tetraphosphatase ApaH/serine/threonine PP2A family protein phosphatase
MRYLVLSDIHANIDALEAVLTAAAGLGYDRALVLGDLVGYGGAPHAVVERIRTLGPFAAVRGNHDKAATGAADAANFNPIAKEAAMWTRGALTAEDLAYLSGLPVGPLPVDDDVEICHGAPFDEDAYTIDSLDAIRALDAASRPICLNGHTHVPLLMGIEGGELRYEDVEDGRVLRFKPGGRYLLNVGSVGQPRDGDARACCAVVDTAARTAQIHRVAYAVEAAQARVREAGLPDALAARLATGR